MLTLRLATPDDIAILKQWDKDPVVAASGGDDDGFDWQTELPRTVEWRELLIAEENGRPVGFMQIIDPATEETHYWGKIEGGLRAIDIWIGAACDRGRGLGGDMMCQALARCFAAPSVKAVIIDPLESNIRALKFYERLGFKFVEYRRFGEDDCAVYRMDCAAWEALAGGA